MASQHETSKGNGNGKVVPLKRRSNLRPVLPIHWGELDAQDVRGAVDAVTRAGGAIMLGRTSDGGALSICILDGDSRVKEYPHTVEEAHALLKAILDEYAGI